MNVFDPFGAVHLVTVVTCAMLIAAVAVVGRHMGEPAELHLRMGLAAFALCFWVVYNAWWNWNGLDLSNGLPLQICDLAGLIAPLALLTLNPWLRATLYFWGFALTIQGFIQPTVTAGPARLEFWMFWTAHTIIVGCAAYDVTALGFRPTWDDFRRICLVSVGYLVLVTPLNLAFGSNYGYVGNPPPDRKIPALIEAFGPWPGRAAVIVGLAALAFLLLLVPWLVIDRFRQPA